jgi:hypothetical protein
MRMTWSKASKAYRLRKVYVPRTYSFRERIRTRIMATASEHTKNCSVVCGY